MPAKPCDLLLLGSQTIIPSSEYLCRARNLLQSHVELPSLTEAIRELPDLWPILEKGFPSLGQIPGVQILSTLKKWISEGQELEIPEKASNTLLTPLTIIIQIADYVAYLKTIECEDGHASILRSVQNGGIQGLCTGFLSAAVLACSRNMSEMSELGAIAIRLAVCVGACVDLDNAMAPDDEQMLSVTCRWTSSTTIDQISAILGQFPGVSVPPVGVGSRNTS